MVLREAVSSGSAMPSGEEMRELAHRDRPQGRYGSFQGFHLK
jgi:hypothetical protein